MSPTKYPETPTPKALLDVCDVARMLGLSSRSVWRLRDRGALPQPVRLSGSVRWRRDELDAWIAGGCVPVAKGGAR